MSFSVVCISRTIAAGGEMIGQAVSQRLGFRYVDEEVIAKAAEKAKVDPKVVAAAEHKQALIKRLIQSIGAVQGMADPVGFAAVLPPEAYFSAGLSPIPTIPEDHRALIREAIREIASEGQAVIVAHAASMALAGREGVLRVLVTASPETRARRLVSGNREMSEADAVAAVRQSDRERRDYFNRFYKIKEELPTNYDLVVNTDMLTPERAVNIILHAAQI
jgi:cytidylate kinase